MTYRLTSFGKTRLALPGIPWRDLTDAEYRAAVARHPGMETQGYFVKAEEPPTPQTTAPAVVPAKEQPE